MQKINSKTHSAWSNINVKKNSPYKKKRVVILGINGWKTQGHDASACLLINNEIKSFVEEERFIRKRYAYDVLPVNAIKYCLGANNLSPNDIDYIAYGWNMPKMYNLNDLKYPYSDKDLLALLFPEHLYSRLTLKSTPKLKYVDHHIAHASSAYRVSGFKNSSILVLDGQGEDASGMLGIGKNGEINIIKKIPIAYSLGYFMEAACVFLGLRTSDAGKLMGLAAYGKPVYKFNEFRITSDGYKVLGIKKHHKGRDQQEQIIKFWLDKFKEKFPNEISDKSMYLSKSNFTGNEDLHISDFSKDFAASIQHALEVVALHIVSVLTKITGERKLTYAGGVALNCVINGKLLSEGYIDDLYIQPAANDAGVSLGAALQIGYSKFNSNYKKMETCYYGPNFSNKTIEEELKKIKIPYVKTNKIAQKAAEAISQGKVIGWFQGRMEVGPRALGARSIIANPKLRQMFKMVNDIKLREQWRPLAPSVKEESIDKFFLKARKSPFMLLTHKVKEKYKDKFPAVVHVDGTTRFQSVTSKSNKRYYDLITEFEKITDIPIILNTSFNIGGEPIVMTPEQAIRTFYSSLLDYLAIGNFWVSKKNGKK